MSLPTTSPKVLTDFATQRVASLNAMKGFKDAKTVDTRLTKAKKSNTVRQTYEPFVQPFTPRERT